MWERSGPHNPAFSSTTVLMPLQRRSSTNLLNPVTCILEALVYLGLAILVPEFASGIFPRQVVISMFCVLTSPTRCLVTDQT